MALDPAANVRPASPPPIPASAPTRGARLSQLARAGGPLLALVLLVIINALFTPGFLSARALSVLLTQIAPIVIVATGMTLVIATGGIDLSVGSLMAMAGALAPLVFSSKRALHSAPWAGNTAAILAALGLAAAMGLVNGTLVTVFQIQPIIATLVLYIAGRGIAQVMTNGNLQAFHNPGFAFLGLGRIGGVPFQFILMALVVGGAAWAVRRTVWGRYVLASGDNENAARLAGVPVDTVKRSVYIISGGLAGLAGLISIAINSASDANQVGLGMELDAIVAVAVGGTPLTGGRASIGGTLIGACIVQLIRFALLARGVPFAAAQMINAAIILLAVLSQRRRGR